MAGRRRFEEADTFSRRRFVEGGASEASGFAAEPHSKRARSIFTDEGDEVPEQKETPKTSGAAGSSQVRITSTTRTVAELIGYVKAIADPGKLRVCEHFLKNDCMWGEKCRFSHNPAELRAGMPATEGINFANLDSSANDITRTLSIPKSQLGYFTTDRAREQIIKSCGVSQVTWDAKSSKITVFGTTQQVESAEQLLQRVTTHCKWGVNEAKVQWLLSPQTCTSARLILAPMTPSLKQMTFNLTELKSQISIGSGSSNDLTLKGGLVSRVHVVMELVPSKGALYIVDQSTNGTFLNGMRLPAKASGRVIVTHGDELLFPEPNKPIESAEFGYMINLEFS